MRQISLKVISAFSLLLLLSLVTAFGQDSSSEAAKLLPKTVGDFRLQGAAKTTPTSKEVDPSDVGMRGAAEGVYVSPKGERLTISVFNTQSHAFAYSYLTRAAAHMKEETQSQPARLNDVGVAGVSLPGRVAFYKGPLFVSILGNVKNSGGEDSAVTFARAYAGTLPDAENEIPVLVKHLPDWETAQDRAVYAVTSPALKSAAGEQPIFEAVKFEEGAEAVTADYDGSRLVIVEYNTPQLAADADARITARLQELKAQGQSTPSAYRRVGNYSVFVFGAPDEAAAARLIDGVKWEQKIQWLGENPLLWARAEKQQTRQAVSLILGIAKTIGFFVGICLGVGALVGGVFFLRRRMQQRAAVESYSDAGGMLRLNIDEMTAETDPSRLLTAGEEKSAAR